MKRSAVAIGLVAAALLSPAAPASAHSELNSVNPAADSVITSSPSSIDLVFNQEINSDFATVNLSDSSQRPWAGTKITVTGSSVTAPVTSKLPPGRYTVAYRVVSADGHPISGQSSFTVGAGAVPSASANGRESASSTAATSSTAYDPANPKASEGPRRGRGPNWVLISVMAVLGLTLGTIGVLLVRRKNDAP